jgi:ATP/maltotriose-dependent transcriptional regulator MalT
MSEDHPAAVDAFDLSIDAAMSIRELKLGAAKRMAYDALATAQACLGDNSPVAAFAAALIAQLAYEEGDYHHCESSLQQVLNAPGERTLIESLVRAYPLAARIALHRGDSPAAVRRLNEGVALAESRGSERLLATCLQELTNLYIDALDLNRARYHLRRLERLNSSTAYVSHGRSVPVEIDSSVANARLLLAKGPSRDAEGLLRRLHREAVARKDFYLAATLELRLVEALQINGAVAESASILISGLHVGMSAGLFQMWIDGGPHVHGMLRFLYTKGEHSRNELQPYLRTIVRRLALLGPAPPNSRTHISKVLLSSRESDILQLMGRGLTNKHIARDLSIAPETVKSHAKSIFEKLQARSRTEEVARVSGWSSI